MTTRRSFACWRRKRRWQSSLRTDRNPELVGALYPFPLFEDGDFDIPSVFMTGDEGLRLAKHGR